METFSDLKELLKVLNRDRDLLSEMFSKRKTLPYKYDYALNLLDDDERRIQYLLDRSVIRSNDDYLELDDIFLQFFEQVLEVNEEINISYVNENIQNIRENIGYYLDESNDNRKYGYLRVIKNILRKVGIVTTRNVVSLRRKIEYTFKNEPSYKVKKSKLENLDAKREAIVDLINQTYRLIDEEELTFFSTALDEEMSRVIVVLKKQMQESGHNLIEIEKQIIDYLNQIKYQSGFIEKLRKVKYLKDQFTLCAETNINGILQRDNALIYEKRPRNNLKLSLDFLSEDDEVIDIIKKVRSRVKVTAIPETDLADNISEEYLETEMEDDVMIDLDEIKASFEGIEGDLFDFVLDYDFNKEVDFDERVTIYCQLVSQFNDDLEITDEVSHKKDIEYAVVYSK